MEIKYIKSQKILSRTQIDLADFVINPYRGCEFGCKYCYSQENKNVKKRKEKWGEFLDVKIESANILRKELAYERPRKVLLGTTTECFQTKEKELRITKSILEVLKEKNIPLVILTKSHLIEEYINLINYNPENKIYFTFMFSDNKIKKLFEEKSPDLKRRIKTIQKLIKNNIEVKIHIGPFIAHMENLGKLFKLIPRKIKEVEIEVYNSKMGNFQEILKIIKEKTSRQKAQDIERIYSSSQDYDDFCKALKEEARTINKNYDFRLNFIVPEFNFWYTDKIKY